MANNANTKLSRYSLMVASEVLDENSGEVYPDILSANYSEFEFKISAGVSVLTCNEASPKICHVCSISKSEFVSETIKIIPLKQIDPNALYWKYSDNNWSLGSNKQYSEIEQFDTISKDDGVWIYSANNHIFL